VGDGSVAARQPAGGRVRRRLCTIPKVVFSRTLDRVQGNARLAGASVVEEVAAAIGLGFVDELRMFRYPVVVGGGTPFLPRSPTTSR